MAGWLPAEPVVLDGTRKAMADGLAHNIDFHSWGEMPCAYHIAYWKHALFANLELSQVSLRRHPRFHEVANHRFADPFQVFLSASHLHMVVSIIGLGLFDLDDLHSIELNDGHSDSPAPIVPQRGHAKLDPDNPDSPHSIGGFNLFDHSLEGSIDLLDVILQRDVCVGTGCYLPWPERWSEDQLHKVRSAVEMAYRFSQAPLGRASSSSATGPGFGSAAGCTGARATSSARRARVWRRAGGSDRGVF